MQSLLPRNAVISTVGGPGKQYWVADPGKNYPASKSGKDADNQAWRGNWRVEISPAKSAPSDQFLTILYPSDRGAAAPVSKLIEKPGKAGCSVTVGGQTFEVLFHTEGPTGGTFNGGPFAVTDPTRVSAR